MTKAEALYKLENLGIAAIQDIPDILQEDEDVLLEMIQAINTTLIKTVSKLKHHKAHIIKEIQKKPIVYTIVPDAMKSDSDIALLAVSLDITLFKNVPEELRGQKDFILKCMHAHPNDKRLHILQNVGKAIIPDAQFIYSIRELMKNEMKISSMKKSVQESIFRLEVMVESFLPNIKTLQYILNHQNAKIKEIGNARKEEWLSKLEYNRLNNITGKLKYEI